MALRPVLRVWQSRRQIECLVYFDEPTGRWEVRMKQGPRVLHQLAVDDASTAYMTAAKWRRDELWVGRA
jgi:hypothetical protein